MLRSRQSRLWLSRTALWRAMWAAMALIVMGAVAAHAIAPPGDIGNQATATFEDGTGDVQNISSNPVITTVQQVEGVLLEADRTGFGAAGNQVLYLHTLTNTGNGNDTFRLVLDEAIVGNDFDLTNIGIFADDGTGQPTGSDLNNPANNPALDIALASGATFQLVVVGTVPPTAADTDVSAITITATSQRVGGTNPTQTNTDTTTVTGNAIITVTKTFRDSGNAVVTSGPADGTTVYTVRMEYENTGNATATNVSLVDALVLTPPNATGFEYVPGSGRWSVTGNGTALTDATGDTQGPLPDTITYDQTAGTVTAILNQVEPGEQGFVTFEVVVADTAIPGTIDNSIVLNYNDGTGPVAPATIGPVTFTVLASRSVVINDDKVNGVPPSNDEDALDNDIVTRNAGTPGGSVDFIHIVENTGDANDNFNITYNSGTFPAGTVFQILQGNGAPLPGANTGSMAPGDFVSIMLRATLPANASGGPFSATVTATSTIDTNISDDVTATLLAVTARSITLTPSTDNAQALPGGVHIYQHTLTNAGSNDEDITIDIGNTGPAFTGEVFLDVGVLGVFEPGIDTLVATNGSPGLLTVTAGTSELLFVRVTVPTEAVPGDLDTATLTATADPAPINGVAAPAPAVATDTTTVVSGDLGLEKKQALDADCDGAEVPLPANFDAFGTTANITANPGDCVCYAIRATNTGSANDTNIVIQDILPTYTTISTAAVIDVGTIDPSTPGVGNAGTIQANVGTLIPAQAAVLTFCLEIEP